MPSSIRDHSCTSFSVRPFLACILIAGACVQTAQGAELSALWGAYKGYHNATLAYQTSPFWTHDFNHSRLDLSLEASAGQVTAPSGTPDHSLWHVGLTPIMRWWLTPQSGMEFGIGANAFSGTYLGSKRISTAYQFGDSIGAFHHFNHTPWTLGVRLTHYSNAEIKRPNPGQDYIQLRVSYGFL
jgi:lipid A 3-O-deacylase